MSTRPVETACHSLPYPLDQRVSIDVLVIEDFDALGSFFSRALATRSFTSRRVESAEEALAVLDSYRPRLILTDLNLPGATGLELVRRLKSRPEFARIPVIALTGDDAQWDQKSALQAGCSDFVLKPVPLGHLLNLVDAHLVPAAA